MNRQRLVVGISGSSGAILGIRLLEALQPAPIETHLIITPSARLTIEQETDYRMEDVVSLADVSYNPRDLSATIASGSYQTMGMVIIPCSIKSLSAIANSYSGDLLTRAADVTLKEGRPLLLVLREAPLHAGHIRLMRQAAGAGAILFPPVPAFYTRPQSVDEIVDNIVGRVLSRMGIENDLYLKWQGIKKGEGAGTQALRREEEKRAVPDGEEIKALDLSIDELWALPAMTLATMGEDGTPHAATVYFASDEKHTTLYFFSEHDTQHGLDLLTNPSAAGTIYPLVDRWQEIRGLQVRGTVSAVPPGENWVRGWDRYLVKFPFAAEMKETVARSTLYAFHLDWVRLIDNRRGFGYKEEWKPA